MYRKKPEGWAKHIDFILLDLICLQAAFVLAYMLRHGARNPYLDANYRSIAIIFSLVDLIITFFFDTMKDVRKRGSLKELKATMTHVILLEAAITFYLFAIQEGSTYSRITFYTTGIIYTGLTYLVRVAWKEYLKDSHRMRENRFLLVTTSDKVNECLEHFSVESLGNLRISALAIMDKELAGSEMDHIPVVAGKNNLAEYLCREWVDEVFVMLPANDPETEKILDQCAEMGITTHLELTRATEIRNRNQMVEQMGGYMVLTCSMNVMSLRQAFAKRFLDIIGGTVGCLITGILVIFLGPAIYIASPGPIFFTQERVGKNGKKFRIYKFRSMYMDAEERKKELIDKNRIKDGMMFKLDFDPRIIGAKMLPDGTIKKGIGNFIRDWSLDEFPQFFNVLKGEMSLVGTRPPTVDEWEKYQQHHRTRLAIKPGITGMWQVSGRSNITDFEEVVRLDAWYINNWSFGLDLRILGKTVGIMVGRDGAM